MRLMSGFKNVGVFLGILLDRLTGKEVTLIVGDSHAVTLGDGSLVSFQRIQRASGIENAYIIWLGPKLLSSVTRKGFPAWVRVLMSGLPTLIAGAARLRIDLVFGEIDVRCHLAPRLRFGGPMAIERLGDDFVNLLHTCVETPGVLGIRYHEPVPPSDLGLQNEAFPVAGTLAERIECHQLLVGRISSAIAARFGNSPRVLFIPNPPGSKLADGSLSPDWTDDGCHFNRSTLAIKEDVMVGETRSKMRGQRR
jgi:hypothetical protein